MGENYILRVFGAIKDPKKPKESQTVPEEYDDEFDQVSVSKFISLSINISVYPTYSENISFCII